MSMENGKNASRSEISKVFSRETTIHGVRRLSDGPLFYRIIWLLFVLGTVVGFFVHLGQLLTRYLQYPVNTESFEGLDDFQFPSVTVCPNDYIHYFYSGSTIPNQFGSNRSVYDMTYDLARIWYRIKSNESHPAIPYYPYSSYGSGMFSLKQVAYRSQQFQTLRDTVVACTFNSRDCQLDREFSEFRDPMRFLCFTFTPGERSVAQTEEGKGLFLLLYFDANSFLTEEQEINHIPGFSVSLHEPGTAPDMTTAFKVPLAHRVSAQVTRRVETKLNRVAYSCTESLGNVTYTEGSGSSAKQQSFIAGQRDCLMRQRQLEFLNKCGCLADHLPTPTDLLGPTAQPCHAMWEPAFFVDVIPTPNQPAPKNNMTVFNFTSGAVTDFEEFYRAHWAVWQPHKQASSCFDAIHLLQTQRGGLGVSGSDCLRLCRRVVYQPGITSTRWPPSESDEYSLNATNNSMNFYLDRAVARAVESGFGPLDILLEAKSRHVDTKFGYFALLDLRAATSSSIHSSEDWVYPLRNLFSDLGGILGLWMGASVITMVELAEFLFRLGLTAAPSVQPTKEPGSNGQANGGGDSQQAQVPQVSFAQFSGVVGQLDVDMTA